MRERRKKARNSGVGVHCAGFMLRAFYNQLKKIDAAKEMGKGIVARRKSYAT